MKKAPAVKIVKKRSGRWIARKRGGGIINGEEKTKLLIEAGKVKKLKAKAKPAEGGEAPAAQ